MTRSSPSAQPDRKLPLSSEQLAVLRSMLEQQRAFRIDQLAQLQQPAPGGLSHANQEIVDSLIVGARAALRDVRAALRRMDAGSYGRCIECGDQIDLRRLEILPQAACCLVCQPIPTRHRVVRR